jgi:hypothetical protein
MVGNTNSHIFWDKGQRYADTTIIYYGHFMSTYFDS